MKTKVLLFLIFFISFSSFAGKYDCIIASKKYEEIYKIPKDLLLSVALTESGKKIKDGEFISWPWTINIKGKGKFFKTKKDAVEFTKNYTKNGKRNIDLGCMQVNYMYHPNAFNTFEEAFDPDQNVAWAAQMLNNLYKKFGTWKEAVGYYHSYRNPIRKKYSAKVFKTLLDIKEKNKYRFIKLAKENSQKNHKIEILENKSLNKHLIIANKKNLLIASKRENKKHSPYIQARMDKVKFFRDYFYKLNKN